MGDQPPIIRRRRSGTYSVCNRTTDELIGTVQKERTGWWIGFDALGTRIGPPRATLPALYGTRRGAVADLIKARRSRCPDCVATTGTAVRPPSSAATSSTDKESTDV